MLSIEEINRTVGNFTGYTKQNFPLDCNGLADMQENERLLSILGNIGGKKYKFSEPTSSVGCYIFCAHRFAPQGELLYLPPRQGQTQLFVAEEPVDIEAQGQLYPAAYKKRQAYWGQGNSETSETIDWGGENGFKLLTPNTELERRLKIQEDKIVPAIIIGAITMWSSDIAPDGWFICNGQEVSKTIYSSLYAVCGDKFGTSTDPSKFKIPNLVERFPVGYKMGDKEFGANAEGQWTKNTGVKTHKLTPDEMPRHSHVIHSSKDGTNRSPTGVADLDKGTVESDYINTETAGSSFAHNNLPPYAIINFIIKY